MKSQTVSTKYFFKPSGSAFAYCSHCGKRVLQDEYNLKKHGQGCGFTSFDIFEILTESNYGYAFSKRDEKTLLFSVYRPDLRPLPGFKDRFKNNGWIPVYEAAFTWNSREIREKGEYSFDIWLALINMRKLPYLSTVPFSQVIASVFPTVPHTYSLTMFYHIYKTKGFFVTPYEPSKYVKDTYCHMKQDEFFYSRKLKGQHFNALICGETVIDGGHPLLALRVYHYTGDPMNPEFYSFLIGERIFWQFQKQPFSQDFYLDIWSMNAKCLILKEDLFDFNQYCPSFCLENYLKADGKNILIPLLCGENFHKGIELLTKSGQSWYADGYFTQNKQLPYRLFAVEPNPSEYSNVSELLSLPKGILKQGPNLLFTNEETRYRINHIFRANRKLIEGLTFNGNIVRFITGQDLTHDGSVQNRIGGISALSDHEIRRILKYLEKLSILKFEEYRDYLQMVYQTQCTDFGYCPKNLKKAHDELAKLLVEKRELVVSVRFKDAVEKYRWLETIDENFLNREEVFEKDVYFIRCPFSLADLYAEGRSQHNCVATYKDWVIDGHCQILFMRSWNDPDQSLVTIEVRGRRLIQAKAPCNKPAPAKQQEFICKWCNHHGISYAGCRDITLRKVS